MKDKVLVGCPIYEGHRKWIKPFIEEHSNYDILFIDNTLTNTGLLKYITKLRKEHPNILLPLRHDWNPKDQWYLHMLGTCYQKLCDYAVNNNYDYFYWTSADISFMEGSSIQNLINHDKDVVGYPTNMYAEDGPPSVYIDNWTIYDEITGRFKLNHYSWETIKDNPQLTKVYGCIGGTLIKTHVLKHPKVKFQYPSNDSNWGEDLIFIQLINDAGFEIYCDFSGRCFNDTKSDTYIKALRNMYLITHDVKRMN